MSQPYIGEIRLFGGNFAPAGWNFCDGSLLSIAQFSALFQLIGTTYGGDGQNTFAVPDLRGRVPVHMGQGAGLQNYVLGQIAGSESVTLTANQVAVHGHGALGSVGGASATPQNATWGNGGITTHIFGTPANNSMNSASVGATGGNQPHDNLHPFQVVSFIISLFGVFPTQG
jgi:microcystin-dependent protein